MLDPRLEELLREIAAEPRSSLLRVPRAPAPRALFEPSPRVGAGAPGLTAAERHLLAVHRHELAWLAKEACKWRLANDPATRIWIGTTLGKGRRTPLQDLAQTRAHHDELRALDFEDSRPEFVRQLEQCLTFDGEPVEVEQIATASLRLQDDLSMRMCLALSLVSTGQASRAVEGLREFATASCPRALRPYLLINLGFAWDVMGRAPFALRAFRHAADEDEGCLVASLYLLLVAVRVEDRRLARVQLDRLHEEAPREELDALLEQVTSRRKVQAWRPSRSQLELVESCARTPELAQRVIHAIR